MHRLTLFTVAASVALAGCAGGSSDTADVTATNGATTTTPVVVADLEVAVAMSNPPGATDGIFFQRSEVGVACGPVQEGSFLYDTRDRYVEMSSTAQVVLRDEVDKIVGTGSLGPGEVSTMSDDGWSCVWRVMVDAVPKSERYQVEVAGIDLGVGALTGDTLRVDLP